MRSSQVALLYMPAFSMQRWRGLILELLQVFGEVDGTGIKFLHAVGIVTQVRVIVSRQDHMREYNVFYLRTRCQFANFLWRQMILVQMSDTANLALSGHCVPCALLLKSLHEIVDDQHLRDQHVRILREFFDRLRWAGVTGEDHDPHLFL